MHVILTIGMRSNDNIGVKKLLIDLFILKDFFNKCTVLPHFGPMWGVGGGLVTPTFLFTDLLIRLNLAHTQNFSILAGLEVV